MRGGKPVPYKGLLDEAIDLAEYKPGKVLMVDRGIDKGFNKVEGRDVDYATLRAQHMDAQVPCEWMESSEPSYILYTSGTDSPTPGRTPPTGPGQRPVTLEDGIATPGRSRQRRTL